MTIIELYDLLGKEIEALPSIGHLCKTTRGEWFIKVSEGAGRNKKNYMSYQNHLYKKTKGEIPDTHCVVFADGNRENFDVSNLILVKKKNVGALFGSMKLYGSGDLILAADKMLELNTMIKEFAG